MITSGKVKEANEIERQFAVGDLVAYGDIGRNGYVVLVTSMTGVEESTFAGIPLGPAKNGPTTIGKINLNYSKSAFRKFYGTVEITQEKQP